MTSVVGLMDVSSDGELRFRMDDHAWRSAVRETVADTESNS